MTCLQASFLAPMPNEILSARRCNTPLGSLGDGHTPYRYHSQFNSSTRLPVKEKRVAIHVDPVCSALCMYDFSADSPERLPLRKGELLEIVRRESSGWWAALPEGSSSVGWVPATFVRPLTSDMVKKMKALPEELRVHEYEAEQRNTRTPISEVFHLQNSYAGACEPESGGDDSAPRMTPGWAKRLSCLHSPVDSAQPLNTTHYARPSVSERNPFIRDDVPRRVNITPNCWTPCGSNISQLSLSGDGQSCRDNVEASSKHGSGSCSETPWYLRLPHSSELEMDAEKQVKSGTLEALVEKLVSEADDPRHAKFRNSFLMTFRTFTSADRIFDILADTFFMDHPKGLTEEESEEWRTKRLLPTQHNILRIFALWQKDHLLFEEEHHIARRLVDLLQRIKSPTDIALLSKLILQDMERQTLSSSSSKPSLIPKPGKIEDIECNLTKLKVARFAQQLTMFESKRYARVTARECITYKKLYPGPLVANLSTFCSTHNMLDRWVKWSILDAGAMAKRTEAVDFWIKVAEKCHYLNNFSSTSAIVCALSSTDIMQLQLTWSKVRRKVTFEWLMKHNDPAGGFAGYRTLMANVDGPCIPFIGMYLTDIAHLSEQLHDEGNKINYRQRQRLYEVVWAILRFQSSPYQFVLDESMSTFLHSKLEEGNLKEDEWFWARSDEIRKWELAYTNICENLPDIGL